MRVGGVGNKRRVCVIEDLRCLALSPDSGLGKNGEVDGVWGSVGDRRGAERGNSWLLDAGSGYLTFFNFGSDICVKPEGEFFEGSGACARNSVSKSRAKLHESRMAAGSTGVPLARGMQEPKTGLSGVCSGCDVLEGGNGHESRFFSGSTPPC